MQYVREAVLADAVEINCVSKHLGYDALTECEATEKLHTLIESSVDQVYVCEYQGDLVGWIHIFRANRLASPSFYEIGGLVVKPNVRGLGLGKALVRYAGERHKGVIRVRCNVTRSEAHRFYEGLGFTGSKSQRVFQSDFNNSEI